MGRCFVLCAVCASTACTGVVKGNAQGGDVLHEGTDDQTPDTDDGVPETDEGAPGGDGDADPPVEQVPPIVYNGPHPPLEVGVWIDVGPFPGSELVGTAGVTAVAIDRTHPSTLYIAIHSAAGPAKQGLWKTTDGGLSWVQMGGEVGDINPYDHETKFFDNPTTIAVDPIDPDHLYITSGVNGTNHGFWVSHDGGENWARKNGASVITGVDDFTTLAVDPTDFQHALIGTHSGPWSGVLETKDGGDNWIEHKAPTGAWPIGSSMGISFLLHPASGQGDSKMWIVHNNNFWRTSDAGASWGDPVSDIAAMHGFTQRYYTTAGVLYSGAAGSVARSLDNGLHWERVSSLPYADYLLVIGDGQTLYAMPSGDDSQFYCSPETDGVNWAKCPGQVGRTFSYYPAMMAFDSTNHILYSAGQKAGFFALKTAP